MLGENFNGPRDMHEALKAQACDMVMPDLMRIGGVTGWMRAVAIAEQYSMAVSSHLRANFFTFDVSNAKSRLVGMDRLLA